MVTPVPYDFDYAGFVGTSYSHPQTWTSIETVTEREYLGYCRDKEQDYLKAIELFVQKKEAIMETINNRILEVVSSFIKCLIEDVNVFKVDNFGLKYIKKATR